MEYKKLNLEYNDQASKAIVSDFHKKILDKFDLTDEQAAKNSHNIMPNDKAFLDVTTLSPDYAVLLKELFSLNIFITESKKVNNVEANEAYLLSNLKAISDVIEFEKTKDYKNLINPLKVLKDVNFGSKNISKNSYLGSSKGKSIPLTVSLSKDLGKLKEETIDQTENFIKKSIEIEIKENESLVDEKENEITSLIDVINTKENELDIQQDILFDTQREIKRLEISNDEKGDKLDLQENIINDTKREIKRLEISNDEKQLIINAMRIEFAELYILKNKLEEIEKVNNIPGEKIDKILVDGVEELLNPESREALAKEVETIVARMKKFIVDVKSAMDEKVYIDAFAESIKLGEKLILNLRSGKIGVEQFKMAEAWLGSILTTFNNLNNRLKTYIFIAVILSVGVTTAVVIGGGATAVNFIVNRFSKDRRGNYDHEKRVKTIRSMTKKLEKLKKEYNT